MHKTNTLFQRTKRQIYGVSIPVQVPVCMFRQIRLFHVSGQRPDCFANSTNGFTPPGFMRANFASIPK
jgi:hypothetical protein